MRGPDKHHDRVHQKASNHLLLPAFIQEPSHRQRTHDEVLQYLPQKCNMGHGQSHQRSAVGPAGSEVDYLS